MKKILITLCALYILTSCYGQKPFLGADLGFQFGKKDFFEIGLNLGLQNKKDLFFDLSAGIEDDINSKLIGYKVGLTACNLKDGGIPIAISLSNIVYQNSDDSFNAIRPEIGLLQHVRHGQGRSVVKLFYGFNFTEDRFENDINRHLIRFSINSDWRSFLHLITFYQL